MVFWRRPLAWLVLLACVEPVLAQEPSKLGDTDLLKRAASEAMAFANAVKALEAQRAVLKGNEEGLAKAREVLAAPAPDLPESPSRISLFDAAAIDALAERHRAFDAGLQARRKAIEDAKTLLEERVRLLAGMASNLKAVVQAGTSARPALSELERRVNEGRIPTDRARIGDEDLAIGMWITRVDATDQGAPATLAGYEREAKEAAEEAQGLGTRPAIAPETEREARRRAEGLELIRQAVRLHASEREEQAKADAANLQTVATRLVEDRRTELAALADAERKADAARITLHAAQDALASFAVPSRDAIAEGDGHPELRQVRRDAALSDALIAYHQKRMEMIAHARKELEALGSRLAGASDAFDRVLRLTVRLAAAVELAEEVRAKGGPAIGGLPEDATPPSLWGRILELALAEGMRRVELADVGDRRRDEAAAEAARKDLAAEQSVNSRLHDQLREEESYAQFLTEMAGRTEEELIALLAAEGDLVQALRARAADAEAAQKQFQEADQKARSLRETIRTIENPFVQVGLARAGGRAQEIQKELARLREAKDGQLPADASARPLGIGVEDPPEAPSSAPQAETASGELLEKARLEQEQTFARELFRYFTDLQTNLDRWALALTAVEEAGLGYAARLSDAINDEKRRHACARELERRYERGRVARSHLPADLSKLLSREAILEARRRRDETLRGLEAVRLRREDEMQGLRAIASLRVWADRLSVAADKKTILIGQPVAHLAAARSAFEALPEVRQQAIAYEAKVRRSSEDEVFDWILSRFMEQGTREQFEKPLTAYYLERVDRERALEEFQAAADAYEEIVETANREREELSGAPAALREATAQRLYNYQVTRHLAAIAAAPERQTAVEDAFRAAYKKDLPLPADTREWALPYWGDQLFVVELRLWAHLKWIAEFELRLSKLGIEADIGRYRRAMAKTSGEIQVQRSTRDRLVADISRVREDYRARARRDTIWAIAQVLVIPLVAYGALRVLRRFGRRLEKVARRAGKAETSEHVRRLSTLTKVTGAAIATVVWVITAMYLLGKLGVNITPILASAGVLGLAIAFGAQTLIKDFLSGFFILLENQYRIGDVIMIDGVGGVVERVSLRTTVLRDLHGTVHYIPNGTLARVSNQTQGWSRVVLDVGVAYKENLDRVIAVLEDVLLKLCADERWGPVVLEREVCGVESLADSSIHVRILVKTPPMRQWELARELRKRIKTRFDAEGIEIPFPQRVIHQVSTSPAATPPAGPDSQVVGRPGRDDCGE